MIKKKKAQRPNNSGLSSKKSRLNNYEYKTFRKDQIQGGKKTSSSPIHHQHMTLPAISSRTDNMARTIKRASIFSLLIALAQFVPRGNVQINITQILLNINSMSSNS